jgi:hypothetical protein
VQRRRLADRREADVARLALLARLVQGRHDVAEHLVDAHRSAVGAVHDHVVQLEHVDMIAPQPVEARLERGRDRGADVRPFVRHAHLGGEHDVWLQAREHTAEILLRGAVAIGRRGVEQVNAGLERARDRALLVGRCPLGHQAADRAAAEGQHRDLEPGAAECALFHVSFSRMGMRHDDHSLQDAPRAVQSSLTLVPRTRSSLTRCCKFGSELRVRKGTRIITC